MQLAYKNVPLGQKRRRGRPCNAVLGLIRRARKSILAAGISDNEDEFEMDDTDLEHIVESSLNIQFQTELNINTDSNSQPTSVAITEHLIIPDDISIVPDIFTRSVNYIYDTLPSNLESFNRFESTEVESLFISPTDAELDAFISSNNANATAISSHINATASNTFTNPTNNLLNFVTTSTNIPKKRGRKPLSNEVLLQRAEHDKNKALEKLANRQSKKPKQK